jgi:hypothetical protein
MCLGQLSEVCASQHLLHLTLGLFQFFCRVEKRKALTHVPVAAGRDEAARCTWLCPSEAQDRII